MVGLTLLGCSWFAYCDLGRVASGLVIWGLCCYVGFCCDLLGGAMLPSVGCGWYLFCFVFALDRLVVVIVVFGWVDGAYLVWICFGFLLFLVVVCLLTRLWF